MFDIFYINNPPKKFPQAVKVKDRNEAREKSRTRFCWILDGYNDYKNFDLLWEPVPWEENQVHVWPSQHQQHGGTELIPKNWNGDINYHDNEIIYRYKTSPIIYIDHGNLSLTGDWIQPSKSIKEKTRFINDYLGTLRRIAKKHSDKEYLWIISSICDYTDFDFTWHPSEWQKEMLHVFPSDDQKFGDTFYLHVPSFLEKSKNLKLLEWYETIVFHDIVVHRLPPAIQTYEYDTIPEVVRDLIFNKIKNTTMFNDPLILFSKSLDNLDKIPTVNLWRPETRTIVPLSKGYGRVIVPRDAFSIIKDEVYDYPYIDKSYEEMYQDEPIDIVFLSNGEKCANDNLSHLKAISKSNRLHVVSNVKGRLNAYRECAKKSVTDWFFVVYAKLRVNKDFDWDWQPDRFQKPKHYIFYAYNPITGDTYGHMAMIAFNKKLVLEHDGQGLDFSMHQEHEVIPILSGEAIYGDFPWDAWRTAFREVIKLRLDNSEESKERLDKWIKATHEWTAKGVNDALLFFDEVNGDFEKLRLSYEWDWLAKYFYMKYITY